STRSRPRSRRATSCRRSSLTIPARFPTPLRGEPSGGEGDGGPDGGRGAFLPGHAVAAMRREKQPVAGAKLARLRFARDEETRGAGNEQHKLVVLLIVPLSFGRRLSGRDDPPE